MLRAAIVVVAALAAFAPTRAAAQGEARISGTVRDQSGAFVPDATVSIRNERTGEERVVKSNKNGLFAVSALKPSTYTIRASFGDFKPVEYTGMLVQVGQSLSLDLELSPAGVTEAVTVAARTGLDRSGLGTHGRDDQRAGGAGTAAQRPPDVAALSPGARSAQQRHRHLRRHPLQRARGAAEHDPVRRRRGHGNHRRVSGQSQRRDSVSVPPAVQPRERPGVPSGLQQLPGGVRHGHRRADLGGDEVRIEQRPRIRVLLRPRRQVRLEERLRPFQEPAQPEAVRRVRRWPVREGSRLLLRQLRGISPRVRHQLHRSGPERHGVPARGAGHPAAVRRVPRSRRPPGSGRSSPVARSWGAPFSTTFWTTKTGSAGEPSRSAVASIHQTSPLRPWNR